jgi:hypothetical protein
MACLCRLQFFANCLAVGKARQSANHALPTAGNSSWQRDLFAECQKKQLAKKIAVGKEPVSCSVGNPSRPRRGRRAGADVQIMQGGGG